MAKITESGIIIVEKTFMGAFVITNPKKEINKRLIKTKTFLRMCIPLS